MDGLCQKVGIFLERCFRQKTYALFLLCVWIAVCVSQSSGEKCSGDGTGNITCLNYASLNESRKHRVVTIEFDISTILNELHRTEIERIYRIARRELVRYLNKRMKTTTTSELPSTTEAFSSSRATTIPDTFTTESTTLSQSSSTLITTTSSVPTTLLLPVTTTTDKSTTTSEFVSTTSSTTIITQADVCSECKARRKRSDNNEEEDFNEDDLKFIKNRLEIVDGVLRISIIIDKPAEKFYNETLKNAADALKEDKTFKNMTGYEAIRVYYGLGSEMIATALLSADYRVWLPILFIIILLLIIAFCIIYREMKNQKDKSKRNCNPEEGGKMSKPPSETSNVLRGPFAPCNGQPLIVHVDSGWLTPYEQLPNEDSK